MHYLRLLIPILAALALPAVSQAAVAVPAGSSTASSGVPAVVSGGAGLSAGPASATGQLGGTTSSSSSRSRPIVRGVRAKIVKGVAYAPSDAPRRVQRIIWAGDKIRHKPYVWGGGHGVWNAIGYDCSGSVSYVLHAAGLLSISRDSTGFFSWGLRGFGHWVTVYTNSGHAFIQVAGVRLDTSAEGDPNPPPGTGPRWRPVMHHISGFEPRHPAGL